MSSHPWCSDVSRDTAIRAAEDAAASERPPLPDHRELPERVARLEAAVFAAKTNHDAAPTAIGGDSQCARHATIGGTQSGLRTERVTLEIVYDPEWCDDGESIEDRVCRGIRSRLWKGAGERVRVVPSSEADAEVERLRRQIAAIKKVSHGNWQSMTNARCELGAVKVDRDAAIRERDAALARVKELEASVLHCEQCNQAWSAEAGRLREDIAHAVRYRREAEEERDAALARVAELERNGAAAARETGQQADAEPVAWRWRDE